MGKFDKDEKILDDIQFLKKKYAAVLDYLINCVKEIDALKTTRDDLYRCCEANEKDIQSLDREITKLKKDYSHKVGTDLNE